MDKHLLNTPEFKKLSQTIALLSAESVEKAKSGHPGMPMGMADSAAVLWHCFLKFNPKDPRWINRDRFVLSPGHGSMLLYSLLHLYGFDVSMDDLKHFRQLKSKTPGHPEYGHTAGVECTTGPLGQGFANGVGMALSAHLTQKQFPDLPLNYKVYGIVSDGDLMEGISYEAASLAGHLGLSKLVYLYDSNAISIDGHTQLTFSEDIQKRFEAQNWFVQTIDGHNVTQIYEAIEKARDENKRPSLIITKTRIAKHAPTKENTSDSHGSPLGSKEIEGLKQKLNWTHEPFTVPESVKKLCEEKIQTNQKEYETTQNLYQAYKQQNPENETLFQKCLNKDLSENDFAALYENLPQEPQATRVISANVQQKLLPLFPNLFAGSADLACSTKAVFKNSPAVTQESFAGSNVHYGIREHAMGAIMNGLAYENLFIPIGSTFLVFSDYMRASIRVAALAKLQSIFIFTHDSFAVGEDGPTHEPIEHIPSLRLIPNVKLMRPGTPLECAVSWQWALENKKSPTVLCLTRQNLSPLPQQGFTKADVLKGGYVFSKTSDSAQLTLVATGSELPLAYETQQLLLGKNIHSRVVSVPCLEIFLEQPQSERDAIIPPNHKTVILEAAQTDPWYKYLPQNTLSIGMTTFGESAPYEKLAEHFGFTPEKVVQKILGWI